MTFNRLAPLLRVVSRPRSISRLMPFCSTFPGSQRKSFEDSIFGVASWYPWKLPRSWCIQWGGSPTSFPLRPTGLSGAWVSGTLSTSVTRRHRPVWNKFPCASLGSLCQVSLCQIHIGSYLQILVLRWRFCPGAVGLVTSRVWGHLSTVCALFSNKRSVPTSIYRWTGLPTHLGARSTEEELFNRVLRSGDQWTRWAAVTLLRRGHRFALNASKFWGLQPDIFLVNREYVYDKAMVHSFHLVPPPSVALSWACVFLDIAGLLPTSNVFTSFTSPPMKTMFTASRPQLS